MQKKQPYDRIVQEIVTAQGESAFHGPVVKFFLRHNEEIGDQDYAILPSALSGFD
ncbi:MAG UNVERIFIED_CONTAM: hypothetical protein LVR29_14255 [Microcystis novacekii LVE1205-3]